MSSIRDAANRRVIRSRSAIAAAGLLALIGWLTWLALQPGIGQEGSASGGVSADGHSFDDHVSRQDVPVRVAPVVPLDVGSGALPTGPSGADAGYLSGVPDDWTSPFVVTGRVVDMEGQPLAAAAIRYVPDGVTSDLRKLATGKRDGDLPETLTGPDGRFTLATRRGIPFSQPTGYAWSWDGPFVVVVDSRCLLLLRRVPRLAIQRADLGTLAVRPGIGIHGRIVDEAGVPITEAVVDLDNDDGGEKSTDGEDAYFVALPESMRRQTTAADGQFSFQGAWPGTAILRARAPDRQSGKISIPDLEAGATVDAGDIVLASHDAIADGGVIAGRVLDSAGKPVAGALLLSRPADWNFDAPDARVSFWMSRQATPVAQDGARTDPDGRFDLRVFGNKAVTLFAGASGFEPQAVRGVWPDNGDVDLQLESENRLELEVIDGAGLPVPLARVRVARSRENAAPGVDLPLDRVRDGQFLVHLVGGELVMLRVEGPGFATVVESLACKPTAHVLRHTVTLAPQAVIAGRVMSDEDVPVAGAWVALRPTALLEQGWRAGAVAADADGRFRLEGIPAGTWTLQVHSDGCEAQLSVVKDLRAGEERTDVVIVMPTTGTIEGSLHHADGTVPRGDSSRWVKSDIFATAVPDGSEQRQGASADLETDGSFRLERLLPGSYVVVTNFGTRTPVDVRPGAATRCDLVVPKPGVIRGRVSSEAGPVSGATVDAESIAIQEAMQQGADFFDDVTEKDVTSDAHGEYALTVRGEGAYSVWATTPAGVATPAIQVPVAFDRETVANLSLSTARVEGTVTDAQAGTPIAGATVSADALRATTDAAGHFVLRNVVPGRRFLLATARGHVQQRLPPVLVEEGRATTDVRFSLPLAASVRVTFLAPNGRPAADGVFAYVWREDHARFGEEGSWLQVKAAAGAATLEGLSPGRYRIALLKAGTASHMIWSFEQLEAAVVTSEAIDIAPGESREVMLRAEAFN